MTALCAVKSWRTFWLRGSFFPEGGVEAPVTSSPLACCGFVFFAFVFLFFLVRRFWNFGCMGLLVCSDSWVSVRQVSCFLIDHVFGDYIAVFRLGQSYF